MTINFNLIITDPIRKDMSDDKIIAQGIFCLDNHNELLNKKLLNNIMDDVLPRLVIKINEYENRNSVK